MLNIEYAQLLILPNPNKETGSASHQSANQPHNTYTAPYAHAPPKIPLSERAIKKLAAYRLNGAGCKHTYINTKHLLCAQARGPASEIMIYKGVGGVPSSRTSPPSLFAFYKHNAKLTSDY